VSLRSLIPLRTPQKPIVNNSMLAYAMHRVQQMYCVGIEIQHARKPRSSYDTVIIVASSIRYNHGTHSLLTTSMTELVKRAPPLNKRNPTTST
jgi:hypothetical protein